MNNKVTFHTGHVLHSDFARWLRDDSSSMESPQPANKNNDKTFVSLKTLLLFLFSLFLFSCTDNHSGKYFPYSGGTIILPLNNQPTSFSPHNTTNAYSITLLEQIYQGLVTHNPETFEIEPCLAQSWSIIENGKKLQFKIRDDVFFHPHPSHPKPLKLTPEDVVFSIELACTPINNQESYAYSVIYRNQLKGAEAFFKGETQHIEGVSIHGNTVTLELIEKDFDFLEKLAQIQAAVVSKTLYKEGYAKDLIGTGPFVFSGIIEKDNKQDFVLTKNKNYYEINSEGYQLPFLDSVVLVVENDGLKQLDLFENDQLHLIESIPPDKIASILGEERMNDFNSIPPKLILTRKPLMFTHYLHFNLLKEEFKDIRVRQAFNYAINREEILKNILKNQAYSIGDAGIVPPAVFSGYDVKKVKNNAYEFNPEKAQRLLTAAGYPNGENFPEISIKFSSNEIPSKVAKEVSEQLKNNLNIEVKLEGVSFQTLIDDQEHANGDLFKSAWGADYYSPESFLINGYSKNVPETTTNPSQTNFSRYKNPQFDAYFEQAKNANNIMEQYDYLSEAESILMKDAPYIILWYEETIKMTHSKVRNLHLNAMNYYSLKEVYIKTWTKKEWEERSNL